MGKIVWDKTVHGDCFVMDVCGRKLFGKSEYVSVKEIQSRLKKVEERGGIWRKMVRSNGGREEGEGGSTKRETQKRSKREGVSECVRAVLCCAVLCCAGTCPGG